MKYPWLFVGAKVVCVDADPHPGSAWLIGDPPVKGAVYTVTAVGPSPYNGVLQCQFAEIKRRAPDRWGYNADRFAPVSTTNTDATIDAMRELMQKARDAMKDPTRIDEVMTVLIP